MNLYGNLNIGIKTSIYIKFLFNIFNNYYPTYPTTFPTKIIII